jgi:hypothetical protein
MLAHLKVFRRQAIDLHSSGITPPLIYFLQCQRSHVYTMCPNVSAIALIDCLDTLLLKYV